MIEVIFAPLDSIFSSIIKEMKRKRGGVVVLLTKPYSSLEPLMIKEGINPHDFVFIDAVSRSEQEGVMNSPITNLTALSITLSEVLQSLPKEHRRVIFDSLVSLLVYHKEEIVKRFIVFTFAQIRQISSEATIILGREKTENSIIPLIEQSADKVSQ